jgi:hypothetical protein
MKFEELKDKFNKLDFSTFIGRKFYILKINGTSFTIVESVLLSTKIEVSSYKKSFLLVFDNAELHTTDYTAVDIAKPKYPFLFLSHLNVVVLKKREYMRYNYCVGFNKIFLFFNKEDINKFLHVFLQEKLSSLKLKTEFAKRKINELSKGCDKYSKEIKKLELISYSYKTLKSL